MAIVCVFCASSDAIDPTYLALARETGQELAKAGHVVLSGGGRVGMMGELAAGARAAGGHTIGVIPQVLVGREVADREADELILTEDLAGRKTAMLAHADAFLVLPGGIGTLDELFEVWTIGALRVHRKPVIVVNADNFYGPLLDWINSLVERGFVSNAGGRLPVVVPDLPSALTRLVDRA